MERKAVSATVSILLLTSMLALAFNVQPVKARFYPGLGKGAATFYVTPQYSNFTNPPTTNGTWFTVNVRIANATFVAGWQVELWYNKELLYTTDDNCSVAADHIFPPGSYESACAINPYNSTYNLVLYAANKYGAVEYNATDAGLITVEFQIIKVPASSETLSSMLYLAAFAQEIAVFGSYTVDGTWIGFNDLTVFDGYFQITPRLPIYDIAVTDVTPSKTVVGQGYCMNMSVAVENQGAYAEAFDVTFYAQSQTAINETGLVGYWKFDEGSGITAHDSSNNGNNGTLINGPTWVDGKHGKALSLDGIDDYVVVSHSTSLDITGTTLTLEAWVEPRSFNGGAVEKWPQFLLKGDYWPSYWLGLTNDGNGYLRGGDAHAIEIVTDDPLTLNTWNHVAMTFDGSNLKFYVNGINVHTDSYSGSITHVTEDLLIGGQPYYSNFFSGLIDEVKIYNRSLSADEIWAEYARAPIPIQTQIVTLESGASTNLTFTWNTSGFVKGNYTISAYATPVPGETDTADNTRTDGTVLVTLPGDVSGDRKVDGRDIALIAKYFGSTSGYPPNADINDDGKVDGRDIAIAAKNFGQIWT